MNDLSFIFPIVIKILNIYLIFKKRFKRILRNKRSPGAWENLEFRVPGQKESHHKGIFKKHFCKCTRIVCWYQFSIGKIVIPQTIRNIRDIWERASWEKKNKIGWKDLEFARAYVSKHLQFWKTYIFPMKANSNIFGSDGN